jgi:hypothetical protein
MCEDFHEGLVIDFCQETFATKKLPAKIWRAIHRSLIGGYKPTTTRCRTLQPLLTISTR